MNSKKAIKTTLLLFTFTFVSYFLIKDEFRNYNKVNALYSHGVKTTASLLDYKIIERTGRLGLKYDSHVFLYEYYDQNNIQHRYRITHGALLFQEQLDKPVIEIVYNPNLPSSAIEALNLEAISGTELLLNILRSIVIALLCSLMVLLLLSASLKKSPKKD